MSFEDKQKYGMRKLDDLILKVRALKKEALVTIQQINVPDNVDEDIEFYRLHYLFGDIPRDIEWCMDSLLSDLVDFQEEYEKASTWAIVNDI